MKKSTKKLIFFLQTSAPEEPDSLLNCRRYWQWHEKAPGRKLFEGHFCQSGAGSSYEAYTERRPYSSKKQTKPDYYYDTRRRLTEITATNNSTAFMDYNLFYDDNNASYYSADNNIFETAQQQHNHNGNVNGTLMSYDFSGASNAVSNFNGPTLYGYTYDQLNRLTLADGTVEDYLVSGTNASASYQIGEERLTYDKIGNIETLKRIEKSTAGSNYTTVSTYSYTYAAGSNRLVNLNNSGAAQRTYTYDANGNLLTDSYKGITSSVYGRSAYVFNLVKNGEAISYLYSTDDQRMYKKVVTTAQTTEEYYLTDAMGRTVAIKDLQHNSWEYYASTNERDARLKPGTTNGARFSEEEAQFFVYDHLGNTRITYTPMQVAGTYTINRIDYVADYFPYGKVLREFVYNKQEKYLTTQHERDQETGLDYRGARYYDSDVARFLSVDPLATKFPQWSTYNYVKGNPMAFIDPDGREATDWIKNNNTGEYKWDNNVNSEKETPEGHKYIGKKDSDIIKDLFGQGDFEATTWDVGLMGSEDDGERGYVFYNGRIDTKLKISLIPNVDTKYGDNGEIISKQFKGIEFFATIVSNIYAAIPGGNPDYILSDITLTMNGVQMTPYMPKGDFMTEKGNLNSRYFTRTLNAKTIQQTFDQSFNYVFNLNGLYAGNYKQNNQTIFGMLGAFGLISPNRTEINMLIPYSNK